MATPNIGSFYLKLTANGNLVGEYTNNKIKKVYSECANRTSKNDNTFTGTFKSSWNETEETFFATLTVNFLDKLNKTKYKLKWVLNNGDSFNGEGFICDNILIGHYTWEDI